MNFKEALERLKIISDALPDDDPDKLEMLNVDGDYADLMEWAIRKRTEALSMADANKELAKIYTDRKARFENKAEGMKDVVKLIMDCAGESKYQGVSGTVSIRDVAPKPIVTDESKVPDEFKNAVIDKAAINQAVKDGLQIEGVSMDNGGVSVTIRVK